MEKHQTTIKLLATLIIIAIIGLPITQLWQVIILLVATTIVWTSKALRTQKIILPIILCLICICTAYLIPTLHIKEGSNLYLPPINQQLAAYKQLPNNVQDTLYSHFIQYYPIDKLKAGKSYNWQNTAYRPQGTYAFSTESLWHASNETRIVHDINFSAKKPFRSSFINNKTPELGYYNWYAKKPPYLSRQNVPFFVKYTIPTQANHSHLCWQGIAFINGQMTTHTRHQCLKLNTTNLPMTITGISYPTHNTLSMQLHLGSTTKWLSTLKTTATCLALLFFILLFKIKPRRLAISLGSLFVILFFLDAIPQHLLWHFNQNIPIDGGNDGLTYKGYGHAIAYYLMHGELLNALRGQADIFYYMPGMQYVCALTSLIFGETDLGLLIIATLFCYTLIKMIFNLFTRNHAIIISLLFLILTAKTMAQYALNNNAEIAAFLFFTAGLGKLINDLKQHKQYSPKTIAISSLLFGLSIIVRPNFLLGVGIILMIVGWHSIKRIGLKYTLLSMLPISIASLAALHNLYFGHQFVPFTSSAFNNKNFETPPLVYLNAFKGLIHGVINTDASLLFKHYFNEWLNNGIYLIPLILVMVRVSQKNNSAAIKLVLLAILGLQLPSLFWVPMGRFTLLPWTLSYLIAIDTLINLSKSFISYHHKRIKSESVY